MINYYSGVQEYEPAHLVIDHETFVNTSALLDLYEITKSERANAEFRLSMESQTEDDWDDGGEEISYRGVWALSQTTGDERDYVHHGVYYVLLPEHSRLSYTELRYSDSYTYIVNYTSGSRPYRSSYLWDAETNIQTIDNWQGSGRTMLIYEFNVEEDHPYYILEVMTAKTYRDIKLYGDTGSVPIMFFNLDNPPVEYSYISNWMSQDEKPYYRSLINNYADYAAASYQDSVYYYQQVNSGYGMMTTLADSTDNFKTTGTTILPGESNKLRLFYGQAARDSVGGLNYQITLDDACTFNSIQVPELQGKTLDGTITSATGTVWYTLSENPDFEHVDTAHGWTTTAPVGEIVRGVYVDYTNDINGDPFILNGNKFVDIYVSETALKEHEARSIEHVIKMNSQQYDLGELSSEVTTYTINQEGAIVLPNIAITASSNPSTGTAVEPRLIETETDLIYTFSIRNNEVKAVSDVQFSDVIPEGLIFDVDSIKIGSAGLDDSLKVKSYSISGNNISITFNNIEANGEIKVTIPCFVSATQGGTRFENTAYATGYNGVVLAEEQYYKSSTLYHVLDASVIVPEPTLFNNNVLPFVIVLITISGALAAGYVVRKRRKEEI